MLARRRTMRRTVAPTAELENRKVIIAEDDFLVRLLLADALRHEGFEVIETNNADDAITALKFHPDVVAVICDMSMRSSEDGAALARYVHNHCAGVALVLAAAHRPAVKAPLFDAFFFKPYQPKDVIEWLKVNTKPSRDRRGFDARVSSSVRSK
jgi:two-component system, response regulator PdtaR